MTRPSRRHCNVIMSRARHGYSEDQLARMLGITRETMRGWAKTDRDFAGSLDLAAVRVNAFWRRIDEEVRRQEMRDAQKALFRPKARKTKEQPTPTPKPAQKPEQPKPVKAPKPRPLTKAERNQEDAAWDHALA